LNDIFWIQCDYLLKKILYFFK